MNDTKRDNLGVHGGQNVLLWYYQIIKKRFEVSLYFFMQGGDGKWDDRKTEDFCR